MSTKKRIASPWPLYAFIGGFFVDRVISITLRNSDFLTRLDRTPGLITTLHAVSLLATAVYLLGIAALIVRYVRYKLGK